jgi:hypothetical protein
VFRGEAGDSSRAIHIITVDNIALQVAQVVVAALFSRLPISHKHISHTTLTPVAIDERYVASGLRSAIEGYGFVIDSRFLAVFQ